VTVRRYRVAGDLPRDVRSMFLRSVRAHSFAPIDPSSDEINAIGWVNSEDREDADLSLGKIMFGDALVLSMRHDTLKPPPREVAELARQKVRQVEAETGNPLGRRELRLVKATVERELRQRILPRIRTVDMAWDLGVHALTGGVGRLYFWSTGKTANENFLDLFVKTFTKPWGIEIQPEGPDRWARDAGLGSLGGDPSLQPTRELIFGFQGVRPGVLSDAPTDSNSEEQQP
jgi:hypothetical protein